MNASKVGIGFRGAQVMAIPGVQPGVVAVPVDGVVKDTETGTITFDPFQPILAPEKPIISTCFEINNSCGSPSVTIPPEDPPSGSMIAREALAPLGENLVRVFHFDNKTKTWNFYDPQPAFQSVNTIKQITPGKIYWIRVNTGQTIGPRGFGLLSGWNQVFGEHLLPAPSISGGQMRPMRVFAQSLAQAAAGGDTKVLRFAVIQPADAILPQAPSNTSFYSFGEDGILLLWDDPKDEDFHHVTVYRSRVAGEKGNVVGMQLKNSAFFDSAISLGETYYYTVESADTSGNRAASMQVAARLGENAIQTGPEAVSSTPADAVDGDLIRASNTVEVYVTKKAGAIVVIRHIVNPRVFDVYGHFGGTAAWSKVVGVDSLGSARMSAWVRGADGKVWEVNGDGTRHHMQMTWQEFASRVAAGDSQLAQNLVFEVNNAELSLYAVGVNVLP